MARGVRAIHSRNATKLTVEQVQEVVDSEAMLRQAQAMAETGSWEWDIANDKITWSDELYRHFDLDPDEFVATYEAFIERIHPDDRDLVNATVEKAFADHKPWAFEHRLVRPNGEERWVFGQGAVEVHDGKPVRMFGTEQDITERRTALEQSILLEQAEKNAEFRANLLNIVAHELNTPMTPLQLQLSILMGDSEKLEARNRKAVEIMERNVRRLTMLVSDVLDMSRSESGSLTLRRETFPVQEVIQDVVDTFEVLAQENGLTLDTSKTERFDVVADSHRVTQVLQNLVKNAIKFTPPGGTVSIHANPDGDGTLFEVKDTGRGLTKEKIADLFQPFAQVHKDQGSGGHGLGLYISKGIVEAHGGTLDVESEGEGKGSTFRFRLPASNPAQT